MSRKKRGVPYRLTDEPITEEQQLRAACTVYQYEASRMLNVRQPGTLNEVPEDKDYWRSLFSFSNARLLEYIKTHPGLAEKLLGRSYDNRGSPSAYMREVPGGYDVGWCDKHGTLSQQRFHQRIEDAAADYVLFHWGMPRL